jgi:hypothetical protein
MVWLLDEEYDRVHRAVHMTEKGTDLQPLKIRYHGICIGMATGTVYPKPDGVFLY